MSVSPSVSRTSVCPSVFRFRMKTSGHRWIFTRLDVCIGVVWAGFVDVLAELSARDTMVAGCCSLAFLLSCKLHCKNECVFCNVVCQKALTQVQN